MCKGGESKISGLDDRGELRMSVLDYTGVCEGGKLAIFVFDERRMCKVEESRMSVLDEGGVFEGGELMMFVLDEKRCLREVNRGCLC